MKRRFRMLLICSLLIALCGCGKAEERAAEPADNTPVPTATQQPPTEEPAVEITFRALDYVTLGDYYDIWLYANRIGMDETGMSIITYEFFSRRAKAVNLNIAERTFDDVRRCSRYYG